MKTLAVCYSKTGTTRRAAEAVAKSLGCELDEIRYDAAAKTIESEKNPSEYERLVLLSPVWAFSLAEPMKLYLARHSSEIGNYSLVVTCSRLGLGGCVRACKKALGRPPERAVKLRASQVLRADFEGLLRHL